MTKLDKLLEAMAAQDWRKALSIAAKFPRLGDHKDAIIRAHEAYEHPDFYQQLGHDISQLIQIGIDALNQRYK